MQINELESSLIYKSIGPGKHNEETLTQEYAEENNEEITTRADNIEIPTMRNNEEIMTNEPNGYENDQGWNEDRNEMGEKVKTT